MYGQESQINLRNLDFRKNNQSQSPMQLRARTQTWVVGRRAFIVHRYLSLKCAPAACTSVCTCATLEKGIFKVFPGLNVNRGYIRLYGVRQHCIGYI